MYSRGHWIIPRGRKPTALIGRKAAVLITFWQEIRSPPGSETRSCIHGGNPRTRESRLSPCTIRLEYLMEKLQALEVRSPAPQVSSDLRKTQKKKGMQGIAVGE